MTISSGTRLGRYEVISPLGAGGMGEVYLAEDTQLGRQVALKFLSAEDVQSADKLRRFEREARAASRLNHPNIAHVYEISEDEGVHFIAMEYVEGQSLAGRIGGHPLPLPDVVRIGAQIADALDEAHARGIIHRDIKPDNVMVRANGLVKILDFGIAKLPDSNNQPSLDGEAVTAIKSGTTPGMIIGTANYMSPEQAKGKVVDARTDIFSFGVVLYEMIAGHLPFEGENALEMISAILKDEPKPLNADVPTEIAKIISKCLRKDRGERYQTIKDVGNDLKDLKQELEFHNKLERTISPDKAEPKTQILKTTTVDQINQTNTNQTVLNNPKTKYLFIGLLSLIVLVGGFIGYKYFSPTRQIESIAVLPFANKSSDADTDYLSDGLAESLIYRLSQLPNLKVSPTSSVFRYKGKETDPQIIAKELGVDSVMTGRITQRGDNLNISVNLVDTRNGKSLWGEQYERKRSELLATQREIAAEIANKLHLKLTGESEQKLAKKYTDNNEAYQLYLKGTYHYAKRTKDNLNTLGIEYFQKAIALDPNFALAYVGLANSYAILPLYAYLPAKEAIPQSKSAAQKALAIDPTLADAHAALAYSLAVYDWNWAEAEREYKRALELNPNVPEIHYRYALHYLIPVGRTAEAIAEINRALELEPLSLAMGANLSGAYMYARQFDKALEQAKKTYNLDPNHPTAHIWLGNIYAINGNYAEAIALCEESLQADSSNQYFLWIAGYAYAKSGRRREAAGVIKKFKEIAKTQYVEPYNVAVVFAAMGEKEQASAELEKAFAERDWSLTFLKVDPFADPLRNDARYKEILKRMNLPE